MNLIKQIPNGVTLCNLVCGILSIIMAFHGKFNWAAYLIFAGAIFDFFDGFVAGLLNAKSELGKQLDSLSDLITFGVAPSIIMFFLFKINLTAEHGYLINAFSFEEGGLVFNSDIKFIMSKNTVDYLGALNSLPTEPLNVINIIWISLIPLFIAICGCIRLAKFNNAPPSNEFKGLPIPSTGIFVASIPLLINSNFDLEGRINAIVQLFNSIYVLGGICVFLGLFMTSNIPMFSLKFTNFKFKGNEIRFLLISVALVSIIVGILAKIVWIAIPFIILLYIILSVINNFITTKNDV